MPEQSHDLPQSDRVGVLTAAVLLTYALTHIIQTPEFTLSIQLPGFYLALPITLGTIMTLLSAGLAATGMDWLLRAHPSLEGKPTFEHWLLPTLMTFVIGVTLSLLHSNITWWFGLGISALLLMLVFMAEYVVVEPDAPNYTAARSGLTALSYALFLIFATALQLAGVRFMLLIPILFLAAGLVTLRILHLDGADRWDFPWAAGIGLVCAQMGAGLHYWPLTALQFSLALTGALYALTVFSTNVTDGLPVRRAALEPGIILALAWSAAAFLR